MFGDGSQRNQIIQFWIFSYNQNLNRFLLRTGLMSYLSLKNDEHTKICGTRKYAYIY